MHTKATTPATDAAATLGPTASDGAAQTGAEPLVEFNETVKAAIAAGRAFRKGRRVTAAEIRAWIDEGRG